MTDVTASREILASPEELWELVSDITRMGDWSPETTGGVWLNGATGPSAGAVFRGTNANGRRSWSTRCEVTHCVPGRSFAFRVSSMGVGVSTWEYSFEPTKAGCLVTEATVDLRPSWFTRLTTPFTGVKDRAARNRETMSATLDALALAVA